MCINNAKLQYLLNLIIYSILDMYIYYNYIVLKAKNNKITLKSGLWIRSVLLRWLQEASHAYKVYLSALLSTAALSFTSTISKQRGRYHTYYNKNYLFIL